MYVSDSHLIEDNDHKPKKMTKLNYLKFRKTHRIVDDFVVVDIETTGLNYEIDKIIQIGAVRFRDNEPIEEFNSYVNPLKRIPEHITKMTKITQSMVEVAPTIDKVLPSFISFINYDTIVVHNDSFDMKFILFNMFELGLEKPPNLVIDSLEFAKNYIKSRDPKRKIKSFKLKDLREFYELTNYQLHNALDDCYICGIVYLLAKGFAIEQAVNLVESNKVLQKKLNINYVK